MTDNPLIRVVDDHESLRTSLEFMPSCEGYEVALFDSAAAFLTGDTPSRDGCVILDLHMPEMNGVELFDELCRRSYRVPVIFLTAHADVDTAVYTMRKGACDFLQKPVNPEKLLPAVARAVAKSRAAKLGMTSIEDEVRRYRLLTEREEQISATRRHGLREPRHRRTPCHIAAHRRTLPGAGRRKTSVEERRRTRRLLFPNRCLEGNFVDDADVRHISARRGEFFPKARPENRGIPASASQPREPRHHVVVRLGRRTEKVIRIKPRGKLFPHRRLMSDKSLGARRDWDREICPRPKTQYRGCRGA